MRIAPGATVAQVNAALGSVGGTIAGAVAGSPQLAVTIPDPGSLAALEDLLDELRAEPGIERATLADMPATNELPTGFASPLSATGGVALGHLVALRMPAAWNARRAIRLADRPTLIVADLFGDGPLSAHVDATYNSGALRQLTTTKEHGYHVVGIAASRYSTDGTAAGDVTGVFPATTPLHVIEGIGSSTQMIGVRIVQAAKARTGRVVVNTSLGWDVAPPDADRAAGGLRLGAARARHRRARGPRPARDLGRQRRGAVGEKQPLVRLAAHRPHRRGRAADGPAAQHARGREPRRDGGPGVRARVPGRELEPRRHDRGGRRRRPLAPVRIECR